MTHRSVSIHIDPVNHSAWVRGWQARALIEACGGKPMWSRSRRSWNTQEKTAKDVVAYAEFEGIEVTLTYSRRVVA